MKNECAAAQQYTDESLSAIHHALRASRRRLVVAFVGYRLVTETDSMLDGSASNTQNVPVRLLAKEIVSIEEGIPLDNATGDPYHNVYTALIQTHLPELDDVGAIKYDENRKEISPDHNLLALLMVTTVSSPVAQMLFHSAVVDRYGDVANFQGSTPD